jgi:arylsulfatase A-like enzyme
MRKWVNRAAAALVCAGALGMACGCSPTEVGGSTASQETTTPRPLAASRNEQAQPQPPRLIVLLSLDTLRADHLGFYGYERFTSPVLDMIAAEGVVFEDASATSPWTLPSHASILTGMFPLSHGTLSMKTGLSPNVATLASHFRTAGYRTAAVVNSTWLKKETFGLTREFDDNLYVQDVADRRAPNNLVTEQAIEWMSEHRDGKLFLFVHYYDVHADYASQPFYEQLFVSPYTGFADGTGWQLTRANFEDDYLAMCHDDFDASKCSFGSSKEPWVVDSSVEKLHFDDEDVRHIIALYDAGIRQLDAEVGRLFTWMRREALLDETLLVITSDHGEEFMEHGRLDHFLPTWQEVLRVPLVLRGPGIPRGMRIPEPVSSIDIAPTLLAIAGVEAPPEMEGLDLGQLIRRGEGVSAFLERSLYGEAAGGLSFDLVAPGAFPVFSSLRRGPYKLIHESKGDRYALYDLSNDPREQQDLASTQPEVTRALIAQMRERYSNLSGTGADSETVELSDEDIERLRSLGYLR